MGEMHVGHLEASFPWGILLVTDGRATEPIPKWESDEDQVTASSTAMVVRILHGDEGSAVVDVWRGEGDIQGAEEFDTTLEVASGMLLVSDALGEQTIQLTVPPGSMPIRVFLNEPREATQVDILVEPKQ